MSNVEILVKFAPWNEKTISSLLNKTIKLSTVYDFNDFNEYRYIPTLFYGTKTNIDYTNDTLKILEKKCKNVDFLSNLKTLSMETLNHEGKTKIINFLKEGKVKQLLDPKEKCLSILNENLAYSSVGIFCISKLDVFKDDSAQLMFAHYAQNLKGIALIYEFKFIINKLHTINYKSSLKPSAGEEGRCIKWYNGDYQDIDDFLYKSQKWEYEKELRIFSKPGIHPAKDHNLTLKAILYTPRFSGEEHDLLTIKDQIYDGKLIIKKIHPSLSNNHSFIMEKCQTKTSDFLNEYFTNA